MLCLMLIGPARLLADETAPVPSAPPAAGEVDPQVLLAAVARRIRRPLIASQWGPIAALPERNLMVLVDACANLRRLILVIHAPERAPPVPPGSTAKP